MNPSHIVSALLQDRTITVGGGISLPTFIAGVTMSEVHEYLKIGATAFGMMASLMVMIYTALKIGRMLKDKNAKE